MPDAADEESTNEPSHGNEPVINWEKGPGEFFRENEDYSKNQWHPESVDGQAWSTSHLKIKDRQCYVSCGDGNGTTVTINSCGHIMQISRFFGYGRSGFFIADQADLSEPWYIKERMDQFMNRSEDHWHGFRLGLDGLVDFRNLEISLKFAFNRWPRFVFAEKNTAKSSEPPETSNTPQDRTGDVEFVKDLPKAKPPDLPKLSIQYFCYQGTVFQRYVIQMNKQNSPTDALDRFKIDLDICIRNLDFERDDSVFNEQEGDLEHRLAPDGCGLIIFHRITPAMAEQMGVQDEYYKPSGPKAAALVVTPFAYGMAQTVKLDGTIDFKNDVRAKFIEDEKVDVTIGYRMQLLEKDQKWRNSMVPTAHLGRMAQAFSPANPFRKIRFSRDNRFDFLIQRNLEHILSVCCIPIPGSPTLGNVDDVSENDSHGGDVFVEGVDGIEGGDREKYPPMPVAITCGDVSGHFIGKRTILSIVQFLCSMLRFLGPKKICLQQYLDNPRDCKCGMLTGEPKACDACEGIGVYCDTLHRRIRTVLEGHASWICTKAAPLKDDGTFSPHYWPTGEYITRWDCLPPPSLIDTPLQLLKLFWLYQPGLDNNRDGERGTVIPAWVLKSNLSAKILSWLSSLDKCNRRGSRAFQEHSILMRPDNEEAKFRLVDHVMICLALKYVEELGYPNHKSAQETFGDRIPCYIEQFRGGNAFEVYSYQRVRKKVLKRFTVEGPPSKQRMFATCRTLTRTRFLFHAKDTFLFDAMNVGFFQDDDKRPNAPERDGSPKEPNKKRSPKEIERVWGHTDSRWKATVDTQASYNEYRCLEWETPLWYALSFILGCHRTRINDRSIEENLKASAAALLDQSLPSGLLPGLLDEDQEPTGFNYEPDRDSYWHAAFETPYVLWTHGKEYFDTHATRERGIMVSKAIQPPTGDVAVNTKFENDGTRTGKLLTKTIPFIEFDSPIDQKRLVAVSDDWLQDEPTVLNFFFTPELSPSEVFRAQSLTKRTDNQRNNEETVISAAAKHFPQPNIDRAKGAVIDVPKKGFREGSDIPEDKTNVAAMRSLMERRTLLDAKKRIIWLHHGDGESALLCYLASPQRERNYMLNFFERHAGHEKYFVDSATSALNEWETELHLSFFGRAEKGCKTRGDFLERITGKISKPSFLEITSRNGSRVEESEFLFQETMSFRFVGDLSDHFWTCHSLAGHFCDHDYTCQCDGNPQEKLEHRLSKLTHDKYKKAWQQRKVLELLLFNEMLEKIYTNTKDILDWVENQVLQPAVLKPLRDSAWEGIDVTDLSQHQSSVTASLPLNQLAKAVHDVQLVQKATSDNYFHIVYKWRMCQRILQVIEYDLSGNIDTITQWNCREEERGAEQPRWTLKHEKKYRVPITMLTILNQRKARNIKLLRARIKAFRESLPSQLESVRDEISFRESESINLFTYATVVFLPLGFATGIFSMSEAPSRSTLVNMVELALIALALTIFALANAKTTGRIVARPIIWAFRSIETVLLKPILLLAVFILNKTMVLFYMYVGIRASHAYQKGFDTKKKSLFESISGALDAELEVDAIAEAREYRKHLDDKAPSSSGVAGGV